MAAFSGSSMKATNFRALSRFLAPTGTATLSNQVTTPSLRYAYPKEGVVTWFDNVAVPVGAKNRDNALKFVAFMLEPENAAIQSNFAGYSNGIAGSSKYMTDELKAAPEVNPPADIKAMFSQTCSKKALQLQDRVWTKLKQ